MAENKVTIVYGADSESYALFVGKPLSQVVAAARQMLTVPSTVSARINDSVITDDTELAKAGDVISFYKESGSKGY